MVGASGHVTLIAGGQLGLDVLIEERARDVRKNDRDDLISSTGHVHDEPGEIVIRVQFSDDDSFRTYRHQFADDLWAARFLQHVEGDIDWETSEVDQVERETLPARHASGFTNALPGRS